MKQSTVNINHIAKLASLKLDPEEGKILQSDIQKVLHYIRCLFESDLEEVESPPHPTRTGQATRPDSPDTSFPRSIMMKNAPETIDDVYIKVPPVFGKRQKR